MSHSKTKPLSLKANSLWNATGCVFYLSCQWLTTVLAVTLSTGYENSGYLAFAMSIGIIFASIALYKVRTFQVSDLTNEYSAQNYIAFRFITIAAGLVFCLAYLAVTTHSVNLLGASLLYLIFKADETFSDVLYGIEQRNERMDYIGKSQFLRGFSSLAGFAIPLALSGNIYLAITVMTLCCMTITLTYDLPRARLFGSTKPLISRRLILSLGKACFLAMVASLFANAIVSIVRQYFGLTSGDEALGIYASVATPAVLIQVAATYLYSPMIGTLAKTLRDKDAAAFKLQFLKILVVIFGVVGILVIALSQVGEPLLELVFGPSIAPYTYLFPFVLIATGCIGVLFYVNDTLIVLRKTPLMLLSNATALTISFISAVVLIPTFGMNAINFSIISASLAGVIIGIFFVLNTRTNNINQNNFL